MRLLRDNVLVKLAPPPVSQGGILLAPSLEAPVTRGKVMQTGPACTLIRPEQFVAFDPSSGDLVDGLFATPHIIIAERHLAAVIEKD
jgi:co-chaperonin GroES (HSP10)